MKYWLRPAVIAGIYAFFGLIWILVTDWISVHWLSEVAETAFVQTVKGTIYILVTAALVYLLTRKSAERLEKSRAWNREVFNGSPDATFLMDELGNFFDVNQAAVDRYGYSAAEFLRMNALELSPPDKGKAAADLIRRGLSEPVRFRFIHTTRDGENIPVDISARPIRYQGKRAILSTVRDLSLQAEMEGKLRLSTEMQDAIIAASPLAIICIDLEGTVLSWNRSAERIFGWREDEVAGRPNPIVPPDKRGEFAALRERVRKTGAFSGVEISRIRKDGASVPISLSVAPVLNADGEPAAIMSVMEDISERKQGELREHHLNRILRTIRDIKHLVMHEADKQVLIDTGCRLIIDNRGYDFARIILIDQHEQVDLWAQAGEEPVRGAFDEREWAQQIVSGFVEFMRGESIKVVGPQFLERLFAFAPQALEKSHLAKTHRLCVAMDYESVRLGFLLVAFEQLFEVDDEEKALLQEMADDLAFAVHTIDVRRGLNAAEEQRYQLERELLQSQKMEVVGKLAGGIAHDFNNILQGITGYAQLILGDVSEEVMGGASGDVPGGASGDVPGGASGSEVLYGYVSEIASGADRAAKLTRQLLAFARKQPIQPEIINLNGVVENLLNMLRRLIGENIELVWLPGGDLWNVFIDPAQFDQVLTNLVVNARDAIDGHGKVVIETGNVVFDEEYCQLHHDFTVGEYVLIAVSDDGAGMSKEVAGQIFEPFFTTKSHDKGTGLGLSTVYGIIKQNLGFINVYSELGEGTTFRIYLPRFASEADGAVKAALAGKAKLSNPGNVMGYGTVLLVEDELPLLRLSALMLENLGYSVKPADSPEMALRLIDEAEGAIDLLMTDVVMPGMTGLELYRAAVGKLPHLRCLYMSGYTPNVIVHKGILDREVFFIQKPFSLRDLSLKIQEVLAD